VATYRILVANLEERGYLEKLDVDESITFMLALKKYFKVCVLAVFFLEIQTASP
jgi:hypothetical protein